MFKIRTFFYLARWLVAASNLFWFHNFAQNFSKLAINLNHNKIGSKMPLGTYSTQLSNSSVTLKVISMEEIAGFRTGAEHPLP